MYKPNDKRYDSMKYLRCGNSGILLPRISLGLWHNFGSVDRFENTANMIHTAFDAGITHFDLANNYGPVRGSAEENFGLVMEKDMRPFRDEMLISTKAGYEMWEGPYGNFGSRKYLISSIDQSLKRMKLDYVDIFYHHRPDPDTPLEETMEALSDIVRSGKALYVGISNYNSEQTRRAAEILKANHTPLLLNQVSYSMINRWTENDGLQETCREVGAGMICFSPLAQGILTDRYLNGVPEDSRAKRSIFLDEEWLVPELIDKLNKLNDLACERGQTLAEMALAWILRKDKVTSVLIGASRPQQILTNIKFLDKLDFSDDELESIDKLLEPFISLTPPM
ncbi:MAG: aldo/keto reductase [Ruminococcus sp.]|nr:aldo/keto reductase [Ruminococcus sp.]